MNNCPVTTQIDRHCNPPVAAPIQLHPDFGYFNLVKLHCPWYVDSSLIDVVAVAYENFTESGKAVITMHDDSDLIFTREGVEEAFGEAKQSGVYLVDEVLRKLKTDPIEAQRFYKSKIEEMAITAIYEAVFKHKCELADIKEIA
jgi:hypothetical protein